MKQKRKQPTRNSVIRSRKISVSMTDDQYNAVSDWAKKNRISKSEAIRSVILSDVVFIGDTPEYIDSRRQLYYEVGKVANNVKQIIRKTNQRAYWKTFLMFEQYYCDEFYKIRKAVQDDFVFPVAENADTSHKISVLVTEPEYKRIRRCSGMLTMSDYVKERLANYQSKRWSIDADEAKKVISFANRIGTVVNRLAYLVNAGFEFNVGLDLGILAARREYGINILLKTEGRLQYYEAQAARKKKF